MKNIFKIILAVFPFIAIGCQTLGEDLVEIPLSDQKIVSSKEIELKKDEKVIIWTKCDVENSKPDFKIKYLIEENNKQIKYDSLTFQSIDKQKIIRASATKEDVIEKSYDDDKDTLVHKENFKFELKCVEFIAPKDGKYTFDFKLAKKPESARSMFANNFTVILRK